MRLKKIFGCGLAFTIMSAFPVSAMSAESCEFYSKMVFQAGAHRRLGMDEELLAKMFFDSPVILAVIDDVYLIENDMPSMEELEKLKDKWSAICRELTN